MSRELVERLVKAARAEAKQANDVIALNRDGGGQGRIAVATAMHRIDRMLGEALDEIERLSKGDGDEATDRLLETLTPSGETKYAYMGEFSWTEWLPDENGIEQGYERVVPWTTIKEIMKAIRERAEITVLPAVPDWQPIETAPKDGTWFLGCQDGEIYPCQWLREEYDEGATFEGWYDLFNQSFEAPTHWRPLPAPPAMIAASSPMKGEDR